MDCTSLKAVIIPRGVTEIGAIAFAGCTELRAVTIPSSVTSIGVGAYDENRGAFSDCPSLTIYGEKDSEAETYAKQWNIRFAAGSAPAKAADSTSKAKTSKAA